MSPRDAGKPDPLNHSSKGRPSPGLLRSTAPGREFLGDWPGSNGRGGPPAPPPALGPSGPDAGSLFKALKRRWLLAAALGVTLAAAAGVGAWYLLTPKFTVAAYVRVAVSTQPILQNPTDGRGDFGTYQKTVAARLKHPHILNEALKTVKQLPLVSQQPDPVLWLQDELKVDLQEGSELVKVSMAGEDPAELTAIVNAVAKAWYDDAVEAEKLKQSESFNKLDKYYSEANEKLHKMFDELARRAKEAGTNEQSVLAEQQKALVASYAEFQKVHSDVYFKLMNAQAKLASFKARAEAQKEPSIPEAVLQEAVEANPQVKEQTAKIIKLQEYLDRLDQAQLPHSDTLFVTAQGRLAAAKRARETFRAEAHKSLVELYRQRMKAQLESDRAQLEEEIATLTEQENSLRAQVKEFKDQAKTVGNSSTDLEFLRSTIAQEQKVVAHMGEVLKTQEVELGRPNRVSLYQEAALQKRDLKRQVFGTAAAPLFALVGVCFCVSWWEYRARRIHSADEVVKGLGMHIVGAVPALPAGDGQFFADKDGETQGQNLLLESIDAIRTVLLRDASVAATRVVMVTSATHGEGKTMLAGHLASSLARAGRRTLLLDGDLRTPAAHQLLEQTLQPGLSEVLLEEINLPEAVRPATAVEGLWLLPAGLWDREVLHALAQDGPQRIFEQLREEFDFIVVDSHPVLAATDALLVGQHADAVILSVLRDVSQVPLASAAVQRLTSLGIRVLGAVVNGVSPEDVYSQGSPYPAHAPAR